MFAMNATRPGPTGSYVRGLACALGLISAINASEAGAQAYPFRPVRIVVPFGAGGIPDVLARAVAERLSQYSGQPFYVENRPGASGNIGGELIARADPDGHHLLMTPANVLTVNPSLFAQMSFDPATAFTPISLVAHMPTVLVVNPGLPVKEVGEFIELAKRQPERFSFASPGQGTSLHLAMEMLRHRTGISILHVPYKSGPEAVSAVASGQVTCMFADLPLVAGHIRAGTLRPLGVALTSRLPQLPDVPTIAEKGLQDFEVSSWFGLVAPFKTPRPIVEQLGAYVAKALREPDVQQRFGELGARLVGNHPDEFADFIRKERAKGEAIVRSANIKLN